MKHPTLLLSSLAAMAAAGIAQTSSTPARNPGWGTMVDPREQAFSIEVPQGWKAYGGMFRNNAVDVRPFIDMTSPDGKTNIRIGDASIPAYEIPNPRLDLLARTHPMLARGAAQQQQFRAEYATGDQFATKYGEQRFGSVCQNLQVYKTGTADPVWGHGIPGSTRITAGWAGFTCTRNGQQMGAYVYSETMEVLPKFGSAGKWYVISLGSVIAPSDHSKEAGDMLSHSYKSLAMNPAWMQAQGQRIKGAVSAVNAGSAASTAVYNQASASFQNSMHMSAQESANFNDVLNGQTYARTANGQTYVVPTGGGGPQWVDPATGVVKESALVPGPNYQQLQPTSR